MGCASSKIEDLPAVALCRERIFFIDRAIQYRFALAESHVAYMQSLRSIASSMKLFRDQALRIPSSAGDKNISELPSSVPVARDPHSNSGSHIHFHSGSDSESDGGVSSDSMRRYGGGAGSGFVTMNYMKTHATPSVTYKQQQQPLGETASYSYYQNSFTSSNPSSYPYSFYGYGADSNSNPYLSQHSFAAYDGSSSSSKPLPLPPSPPKSSSWDFLNFFHDGGNSYVPPPPYTPSRNSREVREEEGIPDLEEEEEDAVVVKQMLGGGGVGSSIASSSGSSLSSDEEEQQNKGKIFYKTVAVENEHKAVVKKEREIPPPPPPAKPKKRPQGASECFREILLQFEVISEAGDELGKLLEVGKLPYRPRHESSVSRKLIHMISPWRLVLRSPKKFRSSSEDAGSRAAITESSVDTETRSMNLSSSLQKCYLWEKKLYDEVKAEERLRVEHEKQCRRLKRLDEKGAEANKIDSTRILIRSLSSKIRISIQVVDKISVKISNLRDDELWPQMNELILGLSRMWKGMLGCQRNQCEAIKGIASAEKSIDDRIEDAVDLERGVLNWTLWFCSWLHAQKEFVRAVNDWLRKCLLYVPEETVDGMPPFSPGSMGAPPLFVAANQWCVAVERISEKEVIDAMRALLASAGGRRNDGGETAEAKKIDREEQTMRRQIQFLEKKLESMFGHSVIRDFAFSESADGSGVRRGLQIVFEATEKLCVKFNEAYDELLLRVEENRRAVPNPR